VNTLGGAYFTKGAAAYGGVSPARKRCSAPWNDQRAAPLRGYGGEATEARAEISASASSLAKLKSHCERVKLGQTEISGGTSSSAVGRPNYKTRSDQICSKRPKFVPSGPNLFRASKFVPSVQICSKWS
jgi:hypothetical protein